MGGYNRWRRALVLSALIHCALLAGFGWLSPFAGAPQPKIEYIEMELADDRPVHTGELPANAPAGQPPPAAGPTPEPPLAAPAAAEGNVFAVSTGKNEPATDYGGPDQGMAAAKQPGGGGGKNPGDVGKAGIRPPQILQKTDPPYPEQARRQGWEGRVVLRLEVLPSGVAGNIGIERSSGYPLLDETAVQAVRRWRFVPARDAASGLPVPCTTLVPLVFRLN
jgi:protein TonB